MAASALEQMSFAGRLALALARRPRLLLTAGRQFGGLVPRRWWTNAPYLPVPRADYLEFRQVTATGSAEHTPQVHDVIVWLEWCRSLRLLPRSS